MSKLKFLDRDGYAHDNAISKLDLDKVISVGTILVTLITKIWLFRSPVKVPVSISTHSGMYWLNMTWTTKGVHIGYMDKGKNVLFKPIAAENEGDAKKSLHDYLVAKNYIQ